MTKSEIIKYSIEGLIVVLLVALLLTMCGRGKRVDDSYKEVLAAKDSIIKAKNENIGLHERLIEESARTNEVLSEKDSILSSSSNNIEKSINSINDKLKVIPGRINRISGNNDSIRSEFARF